MTVIRLVGIVEGHGEAAALRGLLQRLGPTLDADSWIDVVDVIRKPRQLIVKPGQIEAAVQLAATILDGPGAILIVLDRDDDCPAMLGPSILERGRQARSDRELAVVLAKPMFEAWFLAAAESLRGFHGLPADLEGPADPEAIRGPKGWLKERMPIDKPYSPAVHQPAFASRIDLGMARRAPSFDKLCRDVARIIAVASAQAATNDNV